MRRRRRSPYLALIVLATVGVVIGALWFAVAPPTANRSAGIDAELAALKESEAAKPKGAVTAQTPPLCRALRRTTAGTVADASLEELSGLVVSRRTKGVFWAIEDSGAQPVFSALKADGSLVGSWSVPGAENVDWEDLAAGPGPDGPVLYAADIGDNGRKRDAVDVYRVPEPAAPAGGGQTAPAARLRLTYPDGAHDAESLLVDPRRGTLIIVTKDLAGGIYALSKPLPFGGSATLRKVGPAPLSFATAADVSQDGTTVALRGYFSVVVWQRKGNEPLTTTMRRKPCTSPTALDDGQGEAIALSPTGRTAWSVAEGEHPPIYEYRPK